MVHVVPAVSHYGEFTARLLQHQEWRREAMRQAPHRQALGSLRHDPRLTAERPGAGRVASALGGVLVRAGQRLQGSSGVPAATASTAR
jgi:hypothetical protein